MTAAEELVKLYEDAQKKLVKIIQRKALGGSPAVYERNILKQVTALLKKLKKATPEVVRQMVLEGYKTGLESAVEDILKVKIPAPPAYNLFSRVHTAQINLIVRNTVDSLTKAVNIVGRRMQDEIREAGLRATAMKTATAGTVREMQKDLEQRLLGLDLKQQNGRLGVKYKNGKIVPLDKYAAMVSRTTPAEAQNKAKIVQAAEWGYDLVRCTTHAPTCEICAQYQGRVYALTREAANGKYQGPNGEPLRFPLLYETALVHGYETIHPNCRHRFTILPARAYSRAELAEMSRVSMRPFEDTRSDAERKAYAQEQAVKRARNDDLREWRRYRAVLPDQAPATFAGFRSMKRANSQRYQDLKADYRTILDNSSESAILNDREEAAVLEYISGGSYLINAKLREGIPLELHEEESVRQLDSALEKLPIYRGEVIREVSFDGVADIEAFIKRHALGRIVKYPAFTSASVDSGYSEEPSVILKIKSFTGRDLRTYNREEGEILFPRNTRFKTLYFTFQDGKVILELEEQI